MNGRAQKYRFLPAIALVTVLTLIGVGLFFLIRHFVNQAPPPAKKVVQEIRVIRPPPPPPEAPPPPPPPEEKQVDLKQPEPEPDPVQSNEPPPAQLGLDADGSAGSDGFGLAARKGGRDLLASGGSAFTWYAGLLKSEIQERLQDDQRARTGSYSVPVRAWVRDDGTIERMELAKSTGDRARDDAIQKVLAKISRLSQPPPPNMPQPMVLRIVSRA